MEKFNCYNWKISHAVIVLIISSMKGQIYQILIYVSRWRDVKLSDKFFDACCQ